MLYPMFIGFPETVMIIFIAVLVFGPKKIPEIARGLGEGLRMLRGATDEIKREIMKPLDEVSGPITDVKKEVEGYKDSISKEVAEMNPLDDISSEVKKMKDNIEDQIGSIKRN